MRSPRRTAAAMPKRLAPLPRIDCRRASTLTGELSSPDEPAGLKRSDFDASIMFIATASSATLSEWPTSPIFDNGEIMSLSGSERFHVRVWSYQFDLNNLVPSRG